MASVRCLQRAFRLQRFLFAKSGSSCVHMAARESAAAAAAVHTKPTLPPSLTTALTAVSRRCYAKDSAPMDEFRAREKQRERERDAADAAEAAKQRSEETNKEETSAKDAKVNAVRQKILDAALQFVPQHGWTRNAIVQGAEQCGYPSTVHGLFPEGGFALVSHFNGKCNAALVQRLQQQTNNGQQEVCDPLDFLVQAVRDRLEMIVPYKAQWAQAMALYAQPQHASTALAQVLTLIDDICYYSGDRSVDFGWYTRRIGLGTIMKMTELYMLQDNSPAHEQTWDFLKKRMDEAVQLQTTLAQTDGMTRTFQRSFNSAFITARNILGMGYNRH